MTKLLATMASTALLVVAPLGGRASATTTVDQADGLEVYARDVYVVPFSTLRNPDETTDPSAPLFNDSGVNLGVTWGQWSAATARSDVVITRTSRTATDRVRLQLSGLVPNGLYSVFWGTIGPDSGQPLCPGVERTLPLDSAGARRPGAPNAFVADATGRALYVGDVADLFTATQVYFSIVWDWSGQTSYPFPNRGEQVSCHSSFGQDTMRHLLVLQKW